MEKEIDIWKSEYELRLFIDRAERYKIEAVYKNATEENPYWVFDYTIENSRNNYEMFRTQLNRKLTESNNWKAIGIELNQKFLLGINRYFKWFEEHKKELEKFEPRSPYSIMLSIMESTKDTILLYFPEYKNTEIAPLENKKPLSKVESVTKDIIIEEFDIMDKNGWKYAFRNIEDFDTYTNLLTNFFEYKEYQIPKEVIQLKRTCKTKIARTLGEIHNKLAEKQLIDDVDYFKIVRVLNHFAIEEEKELYKKLTRTT